MNEIIDLSELNTMLALDLALIGEGKAPLLTEEAIRYGLDESAFTVDMLLELGRHPRVPADWVQLMVDDPESAGIPGEHLAMDAMFACAMNSSLPGSVLACLLAERSDGGLDDVFIRNVSLPGRSVQAIVQRTLREGVSWSTVAYTHSILFDAYAHPNLTDTTGLQITGVFLRLVESEFDDEDRFNLAFYSSLRDRMIQQLAAQAMRPDRSAWLSEESRSRILVAAAIL